jgi:hypothetical protein
MSACVAAKAILWLISHQRYISIVLLNMRTYIEQQLPNGQFPQTVPPCAAPQVPSAVTAPVAEDAGVLVVGLESVSSLKGMGTNSMSPGRHRCNHSGSY